MYNPEMHSVFLHLRDDKTPHNPNKWDFFGGLQEGDESPKECFLRELQEEITIPYNESDVEFLCEYMNPRHDTYRYTFFVTSDTEKEQMKLGEGASFDWVSLENVFSFELGPAARDDLEYFIKIRL